LLRWERRSQIGLSYAGELVHSGAGYDPGMGFTFRRDFSSLQLQTSYQRLLGARTAFRTLGVTVGGAGYRRNGDGSVESADLGPQLSGELKSGYGINLGLR